MPLEKSATPYEKRKAAGAAKETEAALFDSAKNLQIGLEVRKRSRENGK